MGVTLTPSSTVTVNITGMGPVFSMIAAEDIEVGEAVCQSLTDAGKCYKADANDSGKMPVIGIAKESASAGDTLDIYHGGKVNSVKRDADFSVGNIIYMSTTPGQLTETPSTISGTGQQRLGVATGIDDVLLSIDLTVMWIP